MIKIHSMQGCWGCMACVQRCFKYCNIDEKMKKDFFILTIIQIFSWIADCVKKYVRG